MPHQTEIIPSQMKKSRYEDLLLCADGIESARKLLAEDAITLSKHMTHCPGKNMKGLEADAIRAGTIGELMQQADTLSTQLHDYAYAMKHK